LVVIDSGDAEGFPLPHKHQSHPKQSFQRVFVSSLADDGGDGLQEYVRRYLAYATKLRESSDTQVIQ
jgi:hypothetical protein